MPVLKVKKDGVWEELGGTSPAGSDITVDDALSSTSTNPVQNKVVNAALNNKADADHTHSGYALTSDVSDLQTKVGDSSVSEQINNAIENIDALPKSNGIASGLTVKSPLKVQGNEYPYVLFIDNDGNNVARVHTATSSHRILFYEYGADGSGYSEQYLLPTPNDGLTESKSYNILTSKSPVTIAQGGTGSSNGATGLKNLFAAGNTVLSSHQYGNTLPDPGTPGRIFFLKVSE